MIKSKVNWLALVVAASASVSFAAVTDSTNYDGVNISVNSSFGGYQSLVDRDWTGGEPAYDYSVNILRTGEDTGSRHRAFIGARWRSNVGDGDHVLQWTSPYGDPNTWDMWSNGPEFYQGYEEGYPGRWWSGNTMDPEVMRAGDGTWIMMVQVQINSGEPIDNGQTAVYQADRIMLLTSSNAKDWTKKTDRGVVTNIPNPRNTMLHHPELVYVPWDSQGRPYWLYVCVNVNGSFTGVRRIRSSSYDTFDYNQSETGISGYAEIGNQIGYMEGAPGGNMFVRITHVNNSSNTRRVPALQFSRDGLSWTAPSSLRLEGSNHSVNRNCYFAGLATWEGRGAIESLGNNRWRAIYAATTSETPLAPEIFYSEIGVGSLTIDLSGGSSSGSPVNKTIWLNSQGNGQYVCADLGLGADRPLAANRGAVGGWEQFYVQDAGGGRVALRSNSNNKYVVADYPQFPRPLEADRNGIGAWEQFTWVNNSIVMVK